MPAPVGVFVIWNTIVEIGPTIADAMIGGSHICGRRRIFGT